MGLREDGILCHRIWQQWEQKIHGIKNVRKEKLNGSIFAMIA